MEDIRDLRSGKTSPERSVPTRARISGASLKACAGSGTKPFLFLDMRNGQPQATSLQTANELQAKYEKETKAKINSLRRDRTGWEIVSVILAAVAVIK